MTRIKICGITNLDDGIAAIEAGADMLGFNFYEPSPRSITMGECAPITSVISKEFPDIILVGVFVNMSVRQIKYHLKFCSLKLAQLHGDETPNMVASLKGIGFKALRGFTSSELVENYAGVSQGTVPALLIDSSVKGFYGGSGVVANWTAAAKLAEKYPIILAGGLSSENISEALNQVHPWGVDVASGVEMNPRRKDISKIKAFVQSVKNAQ